MIAPRASQSHNRTTHRLIAVVFALPLAACGFALRDRATRAVILILLFTLTGCANKDEESIPTSPLTDPATTLHELANRAKQVHTLSGEGLITLTRPDGQSVRLDAAIIMRPPDYARVRAWKFNRALFDLTVTPDGVWAVTPDDPQRKDQMKSAGVSAAKLAKTWSVLSGGFFDDPGLTAEDHGPQLLIRRTTSGEPTVVCEVNRDTLTPRRYLMLDDAGKQRFSLTLSRYKQFGQIVWPTRLIAESEGGNVEVELRDIQINPDLPDAAFVPPRRAEKLP
jgi:outer membrane lipoprotein-sorting protein